MNKELIAYHLYKFLADDPAPDKNAPPAFKTDLNKLLGFAYYTVEGLCMLGIMYCGVRIVYERITNGDFEGLKGLFVALIGCIIVAAAAAIVKYFFG